MQHTLGKRKQAESEGRFDAESQAKRFRDDVYTPSNETLPFNQLLGPNNDQDSGPVYSIRQGPNPTPNGPSLYRATSSNAGVNNAQQINSLDFDDEEPLIDLASLRAPGSRPSPFGRYNHTGYPIMRLDQVKMGQGLEPLYKQQLAGNQNVVPAIRLVQGMSQHQQWYLSMLRNDVEVRDRTQGLAMIRHPDRRCAYVQGRVPFLPADVWYLNHLNHDERNFFYIFLEEHARAMLNLRPGSMEFGERWNWLIMASEERVQSQPDSVQQPQQGNTNTSCTSPPATAADTQANHGPSEYTESRRIGLKRGRKPTEGVTLPAKKARTETPAEAIVVGSDSDEEPAFEPLPEESGAASRDEGVIDLTEEAPERPPPKLFDPKPSIFGDRVNPHIADLSMRANATPAMYGAMYGNEKIPEPIYNALEKELALGKVSMKPWMAEGTVTVEAEQRKEKFKKLGRKKKPAQPSPADQPADKPSEKPEEQYLIDMDPENYPKHANGNWQCAHDSAKCRIDVACNHACCREGMTKAQFVSALKKRNIAEINRRRRAKGLGNMTKNPRKPKVPNATAQKKATTSDRNVSAPLPQQPVLPRETPVPEPQPGQILRPEPPKEVARREWGWRESPVPESQPERRLLSEPQKQSARHESGSQEGKGESPEPTVAKATADNIEDRNRDEGLKTVTEDGEKQQPEKEIAAGEDSVDDDLDAELFGDLGDIENLDEVTAEQGNEENQGQDTLSTDPDYFFVDHLTDIPGGFDFLVHARLGEISRIQS